MDSSFYTIPNREVIIGIAKTIPKEFKMSLKMPKHITHDKLIGKRGEIKETLEKFYKNIDPLRRREAISSILIQLPPRFKYDKKLLETFLNKLDNSYRYAIEFRDPSWLNPDTYKILERHEVAYVIVDEPLLPPETIVTTDFTYIRWHGRGLRPWYNYRYTERELREWIPKINKLMNNTEIIYGYFNNHFHGYAVENALEIMDMFGLLDEEGKKELKRIRERISKPYIRRKLVGIDEYILNTKDLNKLLSLLTDEKRLERGLRINNTEVEIVDNTEYHIIAKVRKYDVIIDTQERKIIHNCGDWERVHLEKKLCKHLIKLLTSIPRERGLKITRDILLNIDDWSFEHMER